MAVSDELLNIYQGMQGIDPSLVATRIQQNFEMEDRENTARRELGVKSLDVGLTVDQTLRDFNIAKLANPNLKFGQFMTGNPYVNAQYLRDGATKIMKGDANMPTFKDKYGSLVGKGKGDEVAKVAENISKPTSYGGIPVPENLPGGEITVTAGKEIAEEAAKGSLKEFGKNITGKLGGAINVASLVKKLGSDTATSKEKIGAGVSTAASTAMSLGLLTGPVGWGAIGLGALLSLAPGRRRNKKTGKYV